MGIPNATVIQIRQEGVDNVDDLVDFDKDTIEQIVANLFEALREGYQILTLQGQQVLRFRLHLLYLEPSQWREACLLL